MIQRRTWKDIPAKTNEGADLPDHEGVMLPERMATGTMTFGGMHYQFAGLDRDDIAEQAARWIIQNTGKDEVEQLTLVVNESGRFTSYILTKVGTAVVVSQSTIKPKVYR